MEDSLFINTNREDRPRGELIKAPGSPETIRRKKLSSVSPIPPKEENLPGLVRFDGSMRGRERIAKVKSPRRRSPGQIITASLECATASPDKHYLDRQENAYPSRTEEELGHTTIRLNEPSLKDFDDAHSVQGLGEVVAASVRGASSCSGTMDGEGSETQSLLQAPGAPPSEAVRHELRERLARVELVLHAALSGGPREGDRPQGARLCSDLDEEQLSRVYLRHAALLSALGRFHEALHSASEALRLNPQSAAALYRMGQALFCLSDLSDALLCFHRALERDPCSKEIAQAIRVCVLRIKSRKERRGLYLGPNL